MADELTTEQLEAESKFIEGLPRVNIGALFLPPIWGPVHGYWITILYYPAWLFADNMFYWAYSEHTALSIVLAAITFVILTAVTVIFAIVSQPMAAHRADERGQSREMYLHRQRIWAVVSVIIGCIMLALATYYNLVIRPTLGS